jgi:hypothetical protein
MLYFKPRNRDYKRATDIKQEKRLAKLKGKEPEKKNFHPTDPSIIPQGRLYNKLERYDKCSYLRLGYYRHQHIGKR